MEHQRTRTTVVGAGLSPTQADHTLPPEAEAAPTTIGRFAVLRKLGEGGMGVVYSAYDEELDRRVAIKIVRRAHAQSTERMRREAQAMAKLSHPNVATVYEVGAFEGQLYLAIEFVVGQTLTQWWRESDRSLSEIIDVMSQAGRGLQAAHDAGLVHRDFKPDNVMVGHDGRVRVLDFGLAGANETQASPQPKPNESVIERLAGHSPFDTPLTMTGTMMGTPAYMSPEQFAAQSAGPKSDQFSFCVTLYELLYKERPFAGDTMSSIGASVAKGEIQPAPKNATVPAKVRELVLRGLAVDPEQRHPDLHALLGQLERLNGGARRPFRIALGVAVTLGLAVAVNFTYEQRQLASQIQSCEQEGRAIDRTWNPSTQAALRSSILATKLSYAPGVADNITPWLDRHAESWRQASVEACMNHNVRQRWDAQAFDKVSWCLEDERLELVALIDSLRAADDQAVRSAVAAVSGLGRVARCVDEGRLATMPEPPPRRMRPDVVRIRSSLAKAAALETEGKYEEGLTVSRAARKSAEVLGWTPLVAASLSREGSLLERSGSFAEAEATQVAAFVAAGRASDWDTAAGAANGLIFTIGKREGRHGEGQTWGKMASMAIGLSGDPLAIRESQRLNNLGSVFFNAGDYEHAQASFAGALRINERILGESHPALAGNLSNLGSVQLELAEYDEARDYFGRAFELRRVSFGSDHPEVAYSLGKLAAVDAAVGDQEAAKTKYERVLAMQEQALGHEHPDVADTLNSLGVWHARQGSYDQAGVLFQRAFDIQEAVLGPHHRDLAPQLNNLGNIAKLSGDHLAAKRFFERALEISERTRGPNHHKVAVSLFNLGQLAQVVGDEQEAVEHFRRAVGIFEESLGRDHPRVAYSLTSLAETLTQLGQFEEALSNFERALLIRSAKDTPKEWLGLTQYEFARALWLAPVHQGRDRVRAYQLATAARDNFASLGEREAGHTRSAEAWLEAHPIK